LGDTWTRSKDDFFAASRASAIETMPFFLPNSSIKRTSEALIFSFIGIIFFKLFMGITLKNIIYSYYKHEYIKDCKTKEKL